MFCAAPRRALALVLLALSAPAALGTTYTYTAILNGANEAPPNPSLGTGSVTVIFNDATKMLTIATTFSGLTGTTTQAHIHAATASPLTGTAGIAVTTPNLPGFPLGVTSGSYSQSLDLTLPTSWNPVFITANGGTTAGAIIALLSAFARSTAYFNIHTNVVPGGEIRGFLTVPGSINDPIITGFNGKKFHFDETGDFTLLGEGDGWKVDVTFSGVQVQEGQEVKEKSWTKNTRVIAPNGDMVSCSLPAVQPLSNRVQMATVVGGKATVVRPDEDSVQLAQMRAEPILSRDDQGPEKFITGCRVHTPKMVVTIYQVWGPEQAAAHPEEAWAAPFTWLNTAFGLLQPLAGPVTGIMGPTYPATTVVAKAEAAVRDMTDAADRPARSLLMVQDGKPSPASPPLAAATFALGQFSWA